MNDITKLLLETNDFSGGSLKNINDLTSLLNPLLTSNEIAFNKLIFKAKHITGLKKVLNSDVIIDSKADANIKNEFTVNLEKFRLQLEEAIGNNESLKAKYLCLNHLCLENILTLAEELAWIKKYINSLRDR